MHQRLVLACGGRETNGLRPSLLQTSWASLQRAMRQWEAWRERANLMGSVGRRPFLRVGGAAPVRMRVAMGAWRTYRHASAYGRAVKRLGMQMPLLRWGDSMRHALRTWRGQTARARLLASARRLPYLKQGGAAAVALSRSMQRWCCVNVTSSCLRAAATAVSAAALRGSWRRHAWGSPCAAAS